MISGLVALIFLIAAASNMPGSEIQRLLVPVVKPIAVATGLDQQWAMFAPNPPRRIKYLEVRVVLADGNHRVWTPPVSGGLAGAVSSHRWRKLSETLLTEKEVRPQLARWVVREVTEPDERAVRVQIVLLIVELAPPGVSGPGPTSTQTLYDETLGKH
jgi:hypothetical protein